MSPGEVWGGKRGGGFGSRIYSVPLARLVWVDVSGSVAVIQDLYS